MKKIIEVLIVVMIVALSSNVFAVVESNTNEGANAGQAIRLTDGTNELVINFSPSVNVIYYADSEDDAANKQWYSAVTYHAAGGYFYASSSDSTGIYRQSRVSTQTFADVEIPTSKSMTTEETVEGETTNVTRTAEEYWLANAWLK